MLFPHDGDHSWDDVRGTPHNLLPIGSHTTLDDTITGTNISQSTSNDVTKTREGTGSGT